jgi:hypothetical protein
MAKSKKPKKGATECLYNDNGNCMIFEGLDCPFDNQEQCPETSDNTKRKNIKMTNYENRETL